MRVATGLSVLGVLDVLVGHEALRYLAHCLADTLVAGWFHYHVLAPSLEWFASWVS